MIHPDRGSDEPKSNRHGTKNLQINREEKAFSNPQNRKK